MCGRHELDLILAGALGNLNEQTHSVKVIGLGLQNQSCKHNRVYLYRRHGLHGFWAMVSKDQCALIAGLCRDYALPLTGNGILLLKFPRGWIACHG